MLEIRIIDINVIVKESNLGILRKSWILPVMVHRAVAIIIDAKNSISISFKLHKINIEIIKEVNDSKVVSFNLYI